MAQLLKSVNMYFPRQQHLDKRLCRTLGKDEQINQPKSNKEKICRLILSQSGYRKIHKPSKDKLRKFPLVLVCGAWGSGIAEICSVLEGLGVVFSSPYHSNKEYYERRSLESNRLEKAC